MANTGREISAVQPFLTCILSLVITEELLISLPDAARVKMTPTGTVATGFTLPLYISHG